MTPKQHGKSPRRLDVAYGAGAVAFRESLPFILLRGREAVLGRFRPTLMRYALTEQQWRVMRMLSAVREEEATRLAELAYLHGPSLTRILRDLSRRGLIRRRTPRSDLRRSLVRISSSGLALIAELAPELARANADIYRLCGGRRLKALREILAHLERVL